MSFVQGIFLCVWHNIKITAKCIHKTLQMSSWYEKLRLTSKVGGIQELIGVTTSCDPIRKWSPVTCSMTCSFASVKTLITHDDWFLIVPLCFCHPTQKDNTKVQSKQTSYYWTAPPASFILYNFILIQVRSYSYLFKFQLLQPQKKKKHFSKQKIILCLIWRSTLFHCKDYHNIVYSILITLLNLWLKQNKKLPFHHKIHKSTTAI